MPGGPVLSPQQALDNRHVADIEVLQPVEYPTAVQARARWPASR